MKTNIKTLKILESLCLQVDECDSLQEAKAILVGETNKYIKVMVEEFTS